MKKLYYDNNMAYNSIIYKKIYEKYNFDIKYITKLPKLKKLSSILNQIANFRYFFISIFSSFLNKCRFHIYTSFKNVKKCSLIL